MRTVRDEKTCQKEGGKNIQTHGGNVGRKLVSKQKKLPKKTRLQGNYLIGSQKGKTKEKIQGEVIRKNRGGES